MAIKQIDHGSPAYEQMVRLRYDVLRKPLGLDFSPADLEREKQDILIASFDEEEILGCCILTPVNAQCVRLRQMAVTRKNQGKGIGEAIIAYTENLARDKGYKVLMMHARDTAVGFYEKFGYRVKGEQFTEVNIPHYVMEKQL